ncbi:MAG TPA: UDP-N-acetylmuramate--L-alanine ligase [Streptosporangiaceae bacterium]|nr:UDP-N-acetylmuramate--L-alanine ligase [Streptosporangiaceae bacterium]
MGLVTPVEPVPLGDLGRVHFAAIGGAGMSGIARIMLARGVAVSGCDSAASAQLDELGRLGARVCVGHSAEHLRSADTLVVSSAIRADNPELVQARRAGMRVLHRAAALASVMLGRQSIAVAGTHGKTTTTSMMTTVLRRCGAEPAYVIGGILAETGLGAADGRGTAFVAEADESDGSFLMLAPDAAIVTCVEADHLDNYGSLAEIEMAFEAFAARITPGGLLVTCADDPGAVKLAAAAQARTGPAGALRSVSYGESAGADYRVAAVTPAGMATEFDLTPAGRSARAGTGTVRLRIAVPGRHNALNAAAAYAAAVELGFDGGQVAAGLGSYRGARRRMEPKGEADLVRVLDSYAHHPTELAADLSAARDIAAGGRVIVVFQPHLFSRTRIFAGQFGAALGQADEVFVLDVYAAREDPEPGVTGALVADAVPGGRAVFCQDRSGVPAAVADVAKPGDVVLTMGAGDVTLLGPLIVDALRGRADDGG